MRRAWLVLALLAMACGQPDSPEAPTLDTTTAPETAGVRAPMHVMGLDGKPLAGMIPIATRRPNAFDQPVARGNATSESGESSLVLPPGQTLYVRAWDPSLRYFANNYFEVLPNEGDATAPLDVTMVQAASLTAIVRGENGEPLTGLDVDMTLSHPSLGEWWPEQQRTADGGVLRFPVVPPGKYTVEFRSEAVGSIEIPEVTLLPGGEADLGPVILQP